MSLLVSDMGFLLDQSIVLGLAAVSRDQLDFIGQAFCGKIRAITRILPEEIGPSSRMSSRVGIAPIRAVAEALMMTHGPVAC